MTEQQARATIGRTFNEVEGMDWFGWYPVVSRRTGCIVDVIPANTETVEEQERAERYVFDEGENLYFSE